MNKKISTFFNVWGRSNELKLRQKVLFLPANVLSMSLELVTDKYRNFWPNSMNTFYNPTYIFFFALNESWINLNNKQYTEALKSFKLLQRALLRRFFINASATILHHHLWIKRCMQFWLNARVTFYLLCLYLSGL